MGDVETKREGSQRMAGLALYGYPQCPYCQRVLRAVESLDLVIELRNTMLESEYHEQLLAALGRGTVPVLRIEDEPGDVKWLPESADIVRYLEARFG